MATDQLGNFCPEHSPAGITCFCDEQRDRDRGVHRASGVGNAFGGHNCVCGGLWLDGDFNCCTEGRQEEFAAAKAEEFLADLVQRAVKLRRLYPSLRLGQSYVNALYELVPTWPALLIGEPFDPYYEDANLPAFLEWARTVAGRISICSAHRLWDPYCPQCQVR